MSCKSEGPSGPKRKKVEFKKALIGEEIEKILDEDLSDMPIGEFSSDSDYNHSSDFTDTSDDESTHVKLAAIRPALKNSSKFENIVWEDESSSMKLFPFAKSEVMLQPVLINSPIDYFHHILSDDILDEITKHTNDYALEMFSLPETKKQLKISTWKTVTKEEMLVFLGLILHMGTIRLNRMQDYWKSDTLFGLHVFATNMSRNRFLLLMRTLHFVSYNQFDPGDRLYKIRPIVNLFNVRMSEIYYPGREIILNEPMIFYHGRFAFRCYIPVENLKHGIKLCMITAPDGIILKLQMFTGALKNSVMNESSNEMVMNLLDGMLDVGHSVYMSDYYTNFELAKYLANRKTHCTGLIKNNQKTFPKDVQEKKQKKEETIAKYSNGIMIAKWKDKRDIYYMSNEYKNDMVKTQNKRQETRFKPLPIAKYNTYMPGFDKQNKIFAYYPCEKKILRWPHKLFLHILQLTLINSHLLYNKYSGNKMPFYEFRLSVIRSLIKTPSNLFNPINSNGEIQHTLKQREQTKNRKTMRKQCKNCYAMGKRKDTIYVCTICEGSPGYCLDCAKITHI